MVTEQGRPLGRPSGVRLIPSTVLAPPSVCQPPLDLRTGSKQPSKPPDILSHPSRLWCCGCWLRFIPSFSGACCGAVEFDFWIGSRAWVMVGNTGFCVLLSGWFGTRRLDYSTLFGCYRTVRFLTSKDMLVYSRPNSKIKCPLEAVFTGGKKGPKFNKMNGVYKFVLEWQ